MDINFKPCPFCLADIPVAAKKCKHCGEWVIGDQPAVDQSPCVTEKDPELPPNNFPVLCYSCGTTYDPSADYCPNCFGDNRYKPSTEDLEESDFPFRMLLPIIGIFTGCIIGFFAAHYFAFFGGINLIGEPFSRARNSLVPGHMLLCGSIFGIVGYFLALKIED